MRGLILGGVLSSATLPMPGAPPSEVARYYAENQTVVLAAGLLQIISSLALLVFAFRLSTFVRSALGERGALLELTSDGGLLAATLLLTSALLGFVLALAGGRGLDFVGALRQVNFLAGGTLHLASLRLFVGAASIRHPRGEGAATLDPLAWYRGRRAGDTVSCLTGLASG
jgi:hypothetical protein